MQRRQFISRATGMLAGTAGIGLSTIPGCISRSDDNREPINVWGRKGLSDGKLMIPRAMAVSEKDELYVVDKTGRIQVFLPDGTFQRGWRTPEINQGKPTGLAWSNDGNLLVADTHYFRVLFYSPDGVLETQRVIGGEFGDAPGQFHFVTDVVEDQRGHFFVGQYGQIDQIQEFGPDCSFIRRWGSQGSELNQFSRPQALLIDENGLLWVADAHNHRIQVFDVSAGPEDPREPELVSHWGSYGVAPGEMKYPYGMVFDVDGTLLISEYGNHRVQRFSREGESLDCWGQPGNEPGNFMKPWALIIDSQHKLHVLDTDNHRMQTFRLS